MAKTRQRKATMDTLDKMKSLENVNSHKPIQNTSGNRRKVAQKKHLNDKKMRSKKKNSATTTFSCDKCIFKSKKSETLIRHLVTHIDESFPILTSYSCKICDKKFRKRSRLELHKIKMHRIKDLSISSKEPTLQPLEDCEAILESHVIPQNKSEGCERLENHERLYITSDNSCETFQNSLNDDNEGIPQCQESSSDCEKLIKATKITYITPDNDYKIFHKLDNSLNGHELQDNGCEPQDMSDGYKCHSDSHQITEKAIIQQNKNEDCEKLLPFQVLENATKKHNITKSSNSLTNNISRNTKEKEISSSIETPIKSMTYKNNKMEIKKKSEIKNKTIKVRKKVKRVDKGFACQFCSYKTKIKNVLKAHMIKHSKEQPFSCDQCEFKTGWRSALKKHVMIHTDEKPYACDKCEYRAFQSSNLRRHMKVHSGTKRKSLSSIHKSDQRNSESRIVENHNCDKCTFKTGHPEILVMHAKTHAKQSFICDFCEYKTSSKFRLINHFRRHTKELACSECKFKCKNLDTFNRHRGIHKPQTYILTSYTCNVCNKKFRKLGLFELHKNKHITKLHTNIKYTQDQTEVLKFECELCDYKCKRKHDLAKHKRSHTGEKPYECEICTYKSSTSSHLVVHMRIHTGEKPYICKNCGYRCKQIGLLQKHMKVHG